MVESCFVTHIRKHLVSQIEWRDFDVYLNLRYKILYKVRTKCSEIIYTNRRGGVCVYFA
jgi:hypothetical protein